MMRNRHLISIAALIISLPLLGFLQEDEITIFLVGDSTVADKPYEGGNPEKGWGQVLPLYFKAGVRIENHAVNGRSTKSFIDEGRWAKVVQQVSPGDYVIIEFGHNDQKIKDPSRYADAETDYRKNLIKYISDSRSKGAIPVLATPIVRRRFDEKGNFYDTHGSYPRVVREVAAAESVPLLDLHKKTKSLLQSYGAERSKALFLHFKPGQYASLPKGKADDTHLSGSGAFKVCDLAIEELQQSLPKLVKYLKN